MLQHILSENMKLWMANWNDGVLIFIIAQKKQQFQVHHYI